jgi:hypothetical protein
MADAGSLCDTSVVIREKIKQMLYEYIHTYGSSKYYHHGITAVLEHTFLSEPGILNSVQSSKFNKFFFG